MRPPRDMEVLGYICARPVARLKSTAHRRYEDERVVRKRQSSTPEMIRSRVETSYHGRRIVTEASSSDGAMWTVKVTVLHDAEDETSVVKKLNPGASVTFRTSPGATRAGMLLGREWVDRHGRHERPVSFVIVDRDRPDLVEKQKSRFADDQTVRLIFDRRIRLGESPVADERRWDAEGLSAVLSDKGCIIIRTE